MDNNVFKKTVYDSDEQSLEKKIKDVDKKIPDTSEPVKKTDNNTKSTLIENKIPCIPRLVTTAAIQKWFKEKYLALLIRLTRLLSIQKLQKVIQNTLYHMFYYYP